MKTITARALRNEYARILREMEDAGEGYDHQPRTGRRPHHAYRTRP